MMKTAVTVLQEILVKSGEVAEYECVSQTGPPHQAMFKYRCLVRGVLVSALAPSKKEAKQEVARLMLLELAARGERVPPPYGTGGAGSSPVPPATAAAAAATPRSSVALLGELCVEYRLGAPTYELVGDTGPPHMRQFTMVARVGRQERLATASTKKVARQLAADQLYTHLRANLARLTTDFVEEDALARAHERVMERYMEKKEEQPWRLDLGQRIADYHCGLVAHLEAETVERGLAALSAAREQAQAPELALAGVAVALGLQLQRDELDVEAGGALGTVALAPTCPALAWGGAGAALRYLERALRQERPLAASDLEPM